MRGLSDAGIITAVGKVVLKEHAVVAKSAIVICYLMVVCGF